MRWRACECGSRLANGPAESLDLTIGGRVSDLGFFSCVLQELLLDCKKCSRRESMLSDKIGSLAFLPRPDREPDRDAFFEHVLTGWKRSQFTQNFWRRPLIGGFGR